MYYKNDTASTCTVTVHNSVNQACEILKFPELQHTCNSQFKTFR